jgi:hypothetical protein
MKPHSLLIFLLLTTCRVNAITEESVYFAQAYAKVVVCMAAAGEYKKWDQAAAFDRVFENMGLRVKGLNKSEKEFFYKAVPDDINEIEDRSNKEQSEMCDDLFKMMVLNKPVDE